MGMYWNFPKLLDQGYDQKIRTTERDRTILASARDLMRQELKRAFTEERALKAKNTLLVETARKRLNDSAGFRAPKFRVQGSFAYSTEITAIQHPPQEVDMDDGMFLPAVYFTDGNGEPMVSSSAYFAKVEAVLSRLAMKKGWRLVTTKSTCVRMQVNERLHVDLPLYAIRDTEFSELVEKAVVKASHLTRDAIIDAIEFGDDFYQSITTDNIMLAHREQGWLTSDPRKLEDWFKNAVAVHGDSVRKISRILKAHRDSNSAKSRLSSIAIMVGVVDAFQTTPSLASQKLCDALTLVAGHLDNYFAGVVPNPAFPERPDLALCVGWSAIERAKIRSTMQELKGELERASNSVDRSFAVRLLGITFGEYLVQDVNLMEAVDVTARSFASTAAEQQPEPPVQSYTSG